MPVRNDMTPYKLRIARSVMLIMLLLFGAVAYWQSTRTEPLDPATNLDHFRWVGYGLCVAAMFGIVAIRGVRARAEGLARLTWSLVGSAVAEGAAMFGAVFMLFGGDIWVYALGLLIFLATWGALPDDPEVA